MTTYPTMLSTLIGKLQAILDEQGDMPVAALTRDNFTCAKIAPYVEPYYWDGGIKLPLSGTPFHCSHWVRSKEYPNYKKHCVLSADGPSEPGDTINGEAIHLEWHED